MADASGTSRARREMTTASSTSWCSDSSGSGTSIAAPATPAWRNDEVGFRNSTGSCNQRNRATTATAATGSETAQEEGCPEPGVLGSERRGSDQRGVDLGDRVAELLGVGDVVAPNPDDLRARREEPLHRRHGRPGELRPVSWGGLEVARLVVTSS